MLLSHADPHLTLGGLVERLVRDGLDRYDPARPPRSRRSGGRGSANGERSTGKPARRNPEAVQRSVAHAKGGAVERRSEVEPDDVSVAAVRGGAPHPSAAKWDPDAGRGGAMSVAVGGLVRCADSAAKRPSVTEHDSASPAEIPISGRPTVSPPKHQSESEHRRAVHTVARDGGIRAVSAVRRVAEAEHGGAKSAVGETARCSDSAPTRVTQDGGVHTEGAERLGGAGASAPGRHCEAEHAGGLPRAMRDGGRAASPAKRRRRAAGDGGLDIAGVGITPWRGIRRGVVINIDAWDAGVGGVPDRATCADGLQFEAGRRNASQTTVRGGRRFPTSAATRLAYAAGYSAAGPAERSPALERHLAALSRFEAWPGSRSRYIRLPCGGRCGGVTRVVAAMSTQTAGGAAAPAIGWRSTTSCRSRLAAVGSRGTSEFGVELITGTGTLRATPTPRVCRLKRCALRAPGSIPGSAGGPSGHRDE